MKIGLIADTHFNIFRKNNSFFQHIEKAIDFFIEECEKHNVDMVFILGDLFHTKFIISTDALINTNKIVRKLSSHRWPVYCLIGNHDLISLQDTQINMLDIYKHFENIIIIDKYYKLEFDKYVFHFLPFCFSGLQQQIDSININNNKLNFLFGHFGVSGYVMQYNCNGNDIIECDALSISPQSLKKFTHVFLGHFHGYQTKGNITYVSAPLQSSYNDEHSLHGFVIFNIDNNKFKFEFIENKYSPRFITRKFTKENIKELLTYKNCYIRFLINKHVSKGLLMAIKTKLLENNYDVTFKFDVSDIKINMNNKMLPTLQNWDIMKVAYNDLEHLITEFIKQIKLPENFTEKKLLEVLFK